MQSSISTCQLLRAPQRLCSYSHCAIAERSQGQIPPLPMCPSAVLSLVSVSSSESIHPQTHAHTNTSTQAFASSQRMMNLLLEMCLFTLKRFLKLALNTDFIK